MKINGFAAYDPKAANFQATFTKIKGTNPDAIFIGGLIDENSGQLINDKVAVLGPNTPNPSSGVMLMLPDGFTTDAVFQRSQGGTPDAKGAFFSVAGVGIDRYKGASLDFIQGFKQTLNGKPVDPYAILGAQAGQVLINAIGKARRVALAGDHRRLQHEGEQRPDRQLRVQRERRSDERERSRGSVHDLQGNEPSGDAPDRGARGETRPGGTQGGSGLNPSSRIQHAKEG